MSFSIIAAIAKNNVIGKEGKLPWNIPRDLEHFYKLVDGKIVIMGRKTYESMGGPIKNSKNIVLSRNLTLNLLDCSVAHSVLEVLESYKDSSQEIMIIGGASVYEQFLPFVDKMYLTFIHNDYDGDVFFPEWDLSKWRAIDQKDFKTHSFVTLERI